MTSSQWTLVLLVGLFLSSVGEAYFPDLMKMNKMSAKTNWMYLAHCFANMAVIVLPQEPGKGIFNSNWVAAFGPAFQDIISYILLFAGMALAGAQTKSILYSSSILWSAVLSRMLLGKVLSMPQWGAITLLFVGLCIKSGGGSSAEALDTSFVLGVALILGGCFMHALANVKNEGLISKGQITAKSLCVIIGIYSLLVWIGLYLAGFIIPEKEGGKWVYSADYFKWSSLTAQDNKVTPFNSGVCWVIFTICGAVHAGCFFSLLGSVGSVTSGIVKGMTVSTYVALSAWAFCGIDSSYCFNSKTVASSCVCVLSVLCYGLATAAAKAKKEAPATPMHVTEDMNLNADLSNEDYSKDGLRKRKTEKASQDTGKEDQDAITSPGGKSLLRQLSGMSRQISDGGSKIISKVSELDVADRSNVVGGDTFSRQFSPM